MIGAQQGEGTPSQDDIISALSARRRSLASRSLVNEESFLSACVSPFYHVTAGGADAHVEPPTDVFSLGAMMEPVRKGNQRRKEGMDGWMEE